MTERQIAIRFPFRERYVPRRCRNFKSRSAWMQALVVVQQFGCDEIPAAYRVTRGDAAVAGYEIKSYNGKLWWPVFVGHEPLSVDAFVESAGSPEGYFLATMELSRDLLATPLDVTAEQIDNDLDIMLSRERNTTRHTQWDRAQHSAAQLLFCGELVYREGGEPCYFGVPSERPEGAILALRVGSLRIGCDQPEDGWHLGPTREQRKRAAVKANVFHIEQVDEAFLAVPRGHYQPVLEDHVIVEIAAARKIDAIDYCADAMARAVLLPRTRVSAQYYVAMAELRRQIDVYHVLKSDVAGEIIREGLETSIAPQLDFGIGREEAIGILDVINRRARQSLTEEDDEAITLLTT